MMLAPHASLRFGGVVSNCGILCCISIGLRLGLGSSVCASSTGCRMVAGCISSLFFVSWVVWSLGRSIAIGYVCAWMHSPSVVKSVCVLLVFSPFGCCVIGDEFSFSLSFFGTWFLLFICSCVVLLCLFIGSMVIWALFEATFESLLFLLLGLSVSCNHFLVIFVPLFVWFWFVLFWSLFLLFWAFVCYSSPVHLVVPVSCFVSF